MPAKKMRIELFDSEGNKYSVAFEGQITREKALRLLDLMELLGGTTHDTSQNTSSVDTEVSKQERVLLVIRKQFPLMWFTSREIQASFEQEFKEPISLSTVATYLARLTNKGILAKAGTANRLKYRLSPSIPEPIIKQRLP